jgi:hypothetical protein
MSVIIKEVIHRQSTEDGTTTTSWSPNYVGLVASRCTGRNADAERDLIAGAEGTTAPQR